MTGSERLRGADIPIWPKGSISTPEAREEIHAHSLRIKRDRAARREAAIAKQQVERSDDL